MPTVYFCLVRVAKDNTVNDVVREAALITTAEISGIRWTPKHVS